MTRLLIILTVAIIVEALLFFKKTGHSFDLRELGSSLVIGAVAKWINIGFARAILNILSTA